MKHKDIHLAKATGLGNAVILYGARTGGDGIGGVSILASETFDADGPAKRPSVQVGDPFMEKLLIECTLEVLHAGLVEGIQDLGGAGISCATSELASNGEGGMHVWLDRVLLRDSTLTPEEILMSESQERMCAVVEPGKISAFMAVCEKWDVEADDKKRKRALAAEPLQYTLSAPAGRETVHINSLDTGHKGAVRTKDIPQYTGTKIKGIGTMHKSNAVPIFSDEQAVEISRMRRG